MMFSKEEIDDEIKNEIKKIIDENLQLNSVNHSLYKKFREKNELIYNNAKLLENFIQDIFKIFSKDKYAHINLTSDKLKETLNSILNDLRGVNKVSVRPGRYLTYAVMDENGNICPGVIFKKDMSLPDFLISISERGSGFDLEEYVSDYNDELYAEIEERFSDSKWVSKFKKYAESLIEDDSISVEQFSELLEPFIPCIRGIGDSFWVTFEG